MASIDLEGVDLTFRVRQKGRVTLKEFLLKQWFRPSLNPIMEVRALRDVTMSLKSGDRLGVIGQNGAGKSTLLKLLAGIYPPAAGTRHVVGRISSLFDLALGFEMEANGWENIAFRSYLQGETPRSIKPKLKEIAEFSELGDFLNTPVRYYSSGMICRLAFAIATAIEPEILLVDEVLSVGDLGFQAKARQRMTDMMHKAQIIVMVSHDLGALPSVCDRTIWLENGHIRDIGPTNQIVAAYKQHVQGGQLAKAA